MGDLTELLKRLQLDLTTFATKLRELLASVLPTAKEMTLTIPSGLNYGSVEHGLKRVYRGGIITSASHAYGLVVAPPGTLLDPTTNVVVLANTAVGSDVSVTLWVF